MCVKVSLSSFQGLNILTMAEKEQIVITTYPELRAFILSIVHILETVFEKGRVHGLQEAENLVNGSCSSDETDEIDCN